MATPEQGRQNGWLVNMRHAPLQRVVLTLLCAFLAADNAAASPQIRGRALLSKLHLYLPDGLSDLPTFGDHARPEADSTSTLPATTFPPQPQLITLAPPVPTTTSPPSIESASSGAVRKIHGHANRRANHWPDYSPSPETDEEEREGYDDDNDDDNDDDSGIEEDGLDTAPYSPFSNQRGHYEKRSAANVRQLGRKGKTPSRHNIDEKQRNAEDGDVDKDWRVWRSQFAQQQQWRRCLSLRFGPCPGAEQGG